MNGLSVRWIVPADVHYRSRGLSQHGGANCVTARCSESQESTDEATEAGKHRSNRQLTAGIRQRNRGERTDVGVSLTVQLKCGTGTRGQDEAIAKAKGSTFEDARGDVDELRGYTRGLAEDAR